MRKVLIPMDVHNAFRECDEDRQGDAPNINPKVDPFLHPLLTKLSKKRPTWTFVFSHSPNIDSNGTGYVHSPFTIMDGDEALGRVGKDWRYRRGSKVYTYEIYCDRLKAKLRRHSTAITSDTNKAVNLILGNMYRVTTGEFIQKVSDDAYQNLRNKLYGYERKYTNTSYSVYHQAMSFLVSNSDMFKAQYPSLASKVDDLIEASRNKDIASKLRGFIDNDEITLFAERDGKIYTFRKDAKNYDNGLYIDELSSRYKQAIGMLKLVENDTLIPYVGYRADDNVFIVFGEKPLDTV
jgi:hypothetical protein